MDPVLPPEFPPGRAANTDPVVARALSVLGTGVWAGRREGQPFLLDPAGWADPRINGWFTTVGMRPRSVLTWRKYAFCLLLWLDYLDRVGVAWDQAGPEQVDGFKVWRLQDPRNPRRVREGTFYTDLIAVRLFYDWAARAHDVRSPVLTRACYRPGIGEVEVLASAPVGVRDRDVKWFDPAGYARYRDLGLQGMTADGADDPGWRGRNAQRDAAFADGLYGTGLRLCEWSAVLLGELPPDDPDRGYATCRLAAATAKGRIGRPYWMPRSVLATVLSYVEGERAAAVRRAQQAGRYPHLPDVDMVVRVLAGRRVELQTAEGQTRTVSLDVLDAEQRQRLYHRTPQGLQPCMVWLNEDGLPRAAHGWHHTFDTANRRLARMNLVGFAGSPHMMRHSFALRWYAVGRLLYDARLAHLDEEETRDFRAQFGSTWHLVATLLGHRNPQTTMDTYLEPFRSLDVEVLLAHVEHAGATRMLAELLGGHRLVLGDPLAKRS